MTSLAVQLALLLVFSLALSIVVSAYRDDEPAAIWRGTLRRTLQFAGAVLLIGAAAQVLNSWLLQPR